MALSSDHCLTLARLLAKRRLQVKACATFVSFAPRRFRQTTKCGAKMSELTVIVQYDPSDTFTPGEARFSMLDLVFGVLRDNWPPGMRFTVKGQDVRMIGKVPVRQDGARLEINDSGNYKWVE